MKSGEEYNEWKRRKRAEMRRIIDEAKALPCKDCGVQYPSYVMQFDHVRGVKKLNIGSATRDCSSVDKLLAEIAKCEVVCANCHAARTYFRGQATMWRGKLS